MLDNNLKQQLQAYLQKLVTPVVLTLATNDSAKSNELETFANELVALDGKLSLQKAPSRNGRTPVMAIGPQGEQPRIEFAGIPMGHEFTSLVLALLHSGGHPAKASVEQLQHIAELDQELNFEVYVSLSCHNCPDVVQALNLMAALNPKITSTMIDGALFQDEVDSRNVMAVPSVYLNGEPFASGRMTLEEILAKADTNAGARQAEAMDQKDDFDVLVVGGGPAGAAAAIYAARKGIRTGVVADRFGGQVMDTMAIENFISVTETEGPKLAANLEQHVLTYDVDVMTSQLASGMRRQPETGLVEVEMANGAVLKSRSVIVATGARWRSMNVPGEEEYKGRGVAYCPHCDGPLFKGKKVAVIGGGNSGIEAAIDLAGIVEHVTVLEFADSLRADEVLQRKARSLPNVDIVVNAQTTEVQGDGQRVTGLAYKDRSTGEEQQLPLAGIFVQIGLMPNTDWLKDTLELNNRGEIVVDNHGQTSLEGVFAAGDVTNCAYKQIIISMGSGATAALGAFDHLIRTSAPESETASDTASAAA